MITLGICFHSNIFLNYNKRLVRNGKVRRNYLFFKLGLMLGDDEDLTINHVVSVIMRITHFFNIIFIVRLTFYLC